MYVHLIYEPFAARAVFKQKAGSQGDNWEVENEIVGRATGYKERNGDFVVFPFFNFL